MPKNKMCPTCQARNSDDSMFCLECGAHLERSDRLSIEKKIEQASCHSCGHFNPIEATKCASCGRGLGSAQAAVYRDPDGRLRMVREVPLQIPVKLLCLVTIVASLYLGGNIIWFQYGLAGDNLAKFAENPIALGAAIYLLVCAFVLGSKETRADYKAKAIFVTGLVGLHLLGLQFGGKQLVWKGLLLDRVLLWGHVAGLFYCELFLLRAEFLRSFLTILAFMLGVWCSYPAVLLTMGAGGYEFLLASVGKYGGLPRYVTPGMLCFNLFLPYVGLMMLARLGHQWAETRRYVVNTPTDRAVLRKFRQRALRGVVLDLFVVSILLAVGQWHMHLLGKFNLLTPALDFYHFLAR